MRGILSVGLFVLLATPAWAEDNNQTAPIGPQLPPHAAVVPVKLAVKPPTIVNSHILYLNNCQPGGCAIVRDPTGGDDSRTNHSSIAPRSGTIAAYNGSAATFTLISQCISTALAQFNIQVVTTDPGPNVEHFEMIIAGNPGDIGFDSSYEGVAPFLCDAPGQCQGDYIPNAITYAFANAYPTPTLMCGVALQESAHGWTLDHATASSDPMTYKTYTAPLSFRNGAPCGSDCIYNNNTKNAFGVACAGTGENGTHVCMENGTATQDEVTTIMNLFGPAGTQAPTVAIQSPVTGSNEQIGKSFPIMATCTGADPVAEMDLIVDGAEVGSALASPAMFNAPVTLALGTHTFQVLCGTTKHASASASVSIMIGNTCTVDADCGGGGLICFQNACIAGQNATGGLGAPCTTNTDCKSNQCGDDGSTKLCVIPCDLNAAACPDGFTCLDDGTGSTGVCWLGGGGSSGCATGPGGDKPTAPLIFGLGIVAVWITRRKRLAN